jgi:hypothetical protein
MILALMAFSSVFSAERRGELTGSVADEYGVRRPSHITTVGGRIGRWNFSRHGPIIPPRISAPSESGVGQSLEA